MGRRGFFRLLGAVAAIATGVPVLRKPPIVHARTVNDAGYTHGITDPWHTHPQWPSVRAGDVIVCENGHPICEATEDIYWGEQGWTKKLGKWTQPEPAIGDPIPVCAGCDGEIIF